jgi:hypothetical protein
MWFEHHVRHIPPYADSSALATPGPSHRGDAATRARRVRRSSANAGRSLASRTAVSTYASSVAGASSPNPTADSTLSPARCTWVRPTRLSTLRPCPYEHARMTRGQCGSLRLHRMELSSTAPHRLCRRTASPSSLQFRPDQHGHVAMVQALLFAVGPLIQRLDRLCQCRGNGQVDVCDERERIDAIDLAGLEEGVGLVDEGV